MKQVFSYGHLLKNLVIKDLKLKYRGSILGALWSLLNPLIFIIVYTIVFKHIIRIQMENYGIFILAGILPWNFFSSAVSMSTKSIIDNGNLIKKVYFPREILPIATILFNLSQCLLAFLVFLPVVFYMTGIHISILWLPYILTLHTMFTLSVAFILSAITVFYRDIIHLTEVGLMLLFWGTPIIYPVSMVPKSLNFLINANPLTPFITAYQNVIYEKAEPCLAIHLKMWILVSIILIVGYQVFKHCNPKFAEEL